MGDFGHIVHAIYIGSSSFQSIYYKTLDKQRQNIPSLFEENAPIIYNGNGLLGGTQYAELYAAMPPTSHEVTGFDCHPLLLGNGAPDAVSIALTVSGKVKLGTDPKRGLCGFSESLVLRPQPDGKYKVSTSCYRLVYKSHVLEPETV